MKPSTVSVVLPTYNESGHIVDLVKEVIASIPAGWGYEILVVVRPSESIAETQPQLQPAFLRLSAIISQYLFTQAAFCLFCSPHGNDKVI